MKKLSLSSKSIAYIALLTAISVVLNIYSIPLMDNALKLSFTYLICFVAGAFFGPLAGFLVGGLGDLIGFIIAPLGAWLPLVTLSSALIGFIPGIIFKYFRMRPILKIVVSFVLVYVVCTMFLNTFAIYLVILETTSRTFWGFLWFRLPLQSAIFAINFAAAIVLYYPLQKTLFAKF